MKEVVRAAGLLIYRKINNANEYLLLQSSVQPYHWTPPKGHVDPGEDEWTAALRETKEESNIDANKSLIIHKDFCHVMHYEANNKPKSVTYWLAFLKENEPEIKLSVEHQKMCWATVDEAARISKYPEIEKMLYAAEEFINTKLLL